MVARVLILGGEGMVGHKVFQILSQRFDTCVTFRNPRGLWAHHPLYADVPRTRTLGGVDARHFDSVAQALERVAPEAVVNCIGIVKQRAEAQMPIPSIQINALFPHLLADFCADHGVRLIHLSTDCVFSGSRGRYAEDDPPDPVDLYGRTKLLGEPDSPGCLTLRTSVVGWELKQRTGLLEWFAAQRGRTIKGYRRAIYTGLSTTALAGLIGDILATWPDLDGLYHVASSPITKYDLLLRMRDALGWQDINIEPDDQFHCDRSLVGLRFEAATGWQSPDWDEMIAGLAAEWPTYEQWRNQISE